MTDVQRKGWSLGYSDGRYDGSKKNQIGWFAGGCVGGVLGCGIGGGIVWLIASAIEDKSYIIPEGDSAYKTGYREGYKETSKPRRESFAYRGCLLGSACFITALVIAIEAFSDLPFHGWE